VRDLQDRVIGVVHDVYRVGGAEVFVVRGEPFGEFDLPVVRAFIRIFAPARGEIVVDVDALALEPAKPPRPARTPRARKGDARRAAVPGPGSASKPAEPAEPVESSPDVPAPAESSPDVQAPAEPPREPAARP